MSEREKLYSYFERSFPQTLKYVNNNLTLKILVLEAFIIRQACDILQGIISQESLADKHLERLYIFSLMWSIGAYLELNDRAKMEAFLRQEKDINLDLPMVENDSTMFEYKVNVEGFKVLCA